MSTTTEPGTVDLGLVRDDIAALKAIDAQLKTLTDLKAVMQTKIKEALGDNEIGVVDGRPAVTWKRNAKTKYFNKAALTERYPEIVEEFTELREGNRVFRVVD